MAVDPAEILNPNEVAALDLAAQMYGGLAKTAAASIAAELPDGLDRSMLEGFGILIDSVTDPVDKHELYEVLAAMSKLLVSDSVVQVIEATAVSRPTPSAHDHQVGGAEDAGVDDSSWVSDVLLRDAINSASNNGADATDSDGPSVEFGPPEPDPANLDGETITTQPERPLKELTFDELYELLPETDPGLASLSHMVRGTQKRLLVKIFGEDREALIKRLPLASRQWLMGQLMDKYQKMPVTRATAEGKQTRVRHMRYLFEGLNAEEIAALPGETDRAFNINGTLNTVTNSFHYSDRLEAVGLDLEQELRKAVIMAIEPETARDNDDADSVKAADDVGDLPGGDAGGELGGEKLPKTPFEQAKERVLVALGITSRQEAEAFAQIFKLDAPQAAVGETHDRIRSTLQKVIPLVNANAKDQTQSFSELEQAVIWGIVGRPGFAHQKTPPRGVESLRKQKEITQGLSRNRVKIEEVLTSALNKVAHISEQLASQPM
jgi:hypothetical protein